jgi:3-dehydroquinate dehydratase II
MAGKRQGKTPMKILVVHGPNLNMLGKRDPTKYGTITLAEINEHLQLLALKLDCEIEHFQSNHEGAIIDFLQLESSRSADGVIINPGALVRYAYSLRQAFVDLGKPTIEVHMSDIHKSGVNKSVNVLDDVRIDQVVGLKEESYYQALEKLIRYLREK